jgi:flagellar protein FliT
MPTDCSQFSNEAPLLRYYRRIECETVQMLGAARLDDWQGVKRCESTIAELARELDLAKRTATLQPKEDQERMRILRRLVIADGEVRRLADPRSRGLDAMLASRAGPIALDHNRGTRPA